MNKKSNCAETLAQRLQKKGTWSVCMAATTLQKANVGSSFSSLHVSSELLEGTDAASSCLIMIIHASKGAKYIVYHW